MKAVSFTAHARQQIKDRSRLSIREIKYILDLDLVVLVGREKNKIHKLFWSQSDLAWYVIVQDWDDNTVITILPKNCSRWKISTDSLIKAKRIALSEKNKFYKLT